MKFRLLLWVLGLMMGKASRTNPAFQQQLGDKDLAFQLQTLDGKVARHFIVKDQRITSRSGVHPEPAFAIAFKDAAYGFATMQAKNKQLAFMTGIQDKSIQIKGNPALVIWFQGLTKYLKPKKKQYTEVDSSGASPLPHLTVFADQNVGGGLPPIAI